MRSTHAACGVLGACGLALASAPALGQPLAEGQLVVSGLIRPIWVTYAPGDPADRLFVIEKQGLIRIVENGVTSPTPFLNVDAITGGGTSTSSEQGLLGLAFHPNYQSNGLLYIFHTDNSGSTTLAEYSVLGDPATSAVVDTTTRRVMLAISQPFSNHNGGWIAFGPDGFLYIASGDGGSGNDPQANGQNTEVLLGKLLRIDVNGQDPGLQYRVPTTNPFSGGTPGRDEIWAYGLRNPWRNSFDRATGDLYIGDVGQGLWEEINFQAQASIGGENYGWRCMEGNHSTGLSGCTPFAAGLEIPVHEYAHSAGRCSITGGYVYRGSLIPRLSGRYVFGDYCTGEIWTIPAGPAAPPGPSVFLFDMGDNLTSFGEGPDGELYYTDQNSGQLWKIVAVACSDADLTNGAVPGQPGYGVPNGVLTNDDFFYYLAQFAAGNVAVADLTTGAVAGQPGYGVPNGVITNDDFFYYLTIFGAGCSN
ncbi:MAG: PQQ-dependent sugar dehydrogenase [Phycisphaeraceae bacterium]|nr:PQQ-dependent sugar dehydrogenase [Phycisphaeraceae bacterium]